MRSIRVLFASSLIGGVLVHCAPSDTVDPLLADDAGDAAADGDLSNDANASGDALADATSDTGSDADPPSDAGVEEPYAIPDGSVTCATTPCAVAITGSTSNTGWLAFCARMNDGTVQCWGDNFNNHLGVPIDADDFIPHSSVPRKVETLSAVTSVSLGGGNGCAVRSDGSVWCWGTSALLQAGLNPDAGASLGTSALPTRLDLVPAASTVGVGKNTACVTTAAGALHCWGNNETNQLGPRAPDASLPPASVPLGNQAALAARPTAGRTFAITRDKQLWSWGSAGCTDPATCRYLLGRSSSEDPDPAPTHALSLQFVRAVASGTAHSCAVAGKLVECWGENTYGQLGIGTMDTTRTLPQPSTLASVVHDDDVDAGLAGDDDIPLDVGIADTATCAVMGSGRVYCWGWPQTPAADRGRPIRVDGFSGPVVAVAVASTSPNGGTGSGTGSSAACALLRSGAVECWGLNNFGSLGRGIETNRFIDPVPAPVVFSQN